MVNSKNRELIISIVYLIVSNLELTAASVLLV